MERWYQQPVRVMDDGHLTPPHTSVSQVGIFTVMTVYSIRSLLSVVTCDSPAAPSNDMAVSGGIPPISLDSQVIYRCDDGLFPLDVRTSMCPDVGGRGEWVENPGSLVCRERPGEAANSVSTLLLYMQLIAQYPRSPPMEL